MSEDRDFEIYADDLFKCLIPKRLNIPTYANQVKREPGEPDSNFNPSVGIPISILSDYLQKKFHDQFFPENALEIQNEDSIVLYYTKCTQGLHCVNECGVFDKLLVLATIIEELAAFCFLGGNRRIVHIVPRLYLCAFRHYFKRDFFDNGGWDAWNSYVCSEMEFYNEARLKTSAKDRQARGDSEWVKRTTRRVRALAETAVFVSMNLRLQKIQSAEKNCLEEKFLPEREACIDLLNFVSKIESNLEGSKLKCTLSIDCPEAKIFEPMSGQIMLIFKHIISYEKNTIYEMISNIISNENHVKLLLRYCTFIKVIIKFIRGKIRMNNTDILQFIELLLKNNPLMAVFCIDFMQNIYELLNRKRSEKYSEIITLEAISRGLNLTKGNFDIPFVKQITSNKREIPSMLEDHKNLLCWFLDEIAPKNKPGTPASQIFKILSDEESAIILLNSHLFRKLIYARLNFPINPFSDGWILVIMKLLLDCFQTSKDKTVQIDYTKVAISSADEISKNFTYPKITKSISKNAPSNATKTQSSFSCCCETMTKIVTSDYPNMESTQLRNSSQEIGKTEASEESDLSAETKYTQLPSASNHEIDKAETVEDSVLSEETAHIQLASTSMHESNKAGTVQSDNFTMETTNIPVSSTSGHTTVMTKTVKGDNLNIKATNTSVSSTSSHETVMAKTVEDDNLNMEKETRIQNIRMRRCQVCYPFLDRIKQSNFTIHDGQNTEVFIPIKIREKRETQEKMTREKNGKSSLHKKNLSIEYLIEELETVGEINLLLTNLDINDDSVS